MDLSAASHVWVSHWQHGRENEPADLLASFSSVHTKTLKPRGTALIFKLGHMKSELSLSPKTFKETFRSVLWKMISFIFINMNVYVEEK